ncbi:hypothetical protein AB0I84_07020 [Streptomyces spectabilis]|uniref:hypothetical protein n=1 Tax=Streptomyces spectabilis TaxID=68270 RepID=UPI0033EE7E03
MTRVPVGKVIALAAMPTAVLMGMGLTPQLAQAKPGVPENPFQDGPCVTAPDEKPTDPDEDAEKEAARKKRAEDARKRAEEAKNKREREEKGEADKPTPSPSAETPERVKPSPSADAKAPEPERESEPEREPEPSKPTNPLDPLGVGDAIKDLLTPDEREKVEGDGSRDGKTTEPVEDKAEDKSEDKTEDKTEDKAEETPDAKADDDKSEPAPEESKASKAPEAPKDPMAPDENGKKPFPCVVEKKVAGDDEQSPAPIPNQPWHLEASSLLLKGADYQGVVNLKMPNGRTKQALKYVISGGTEIGDLHQIVDGPGGKKYHVQAAKGSKSTISKGDTTMYTERISGNLFGLLPVTFDPEHPPPLNLPLIYFTDVKVQQAGQFGGELTIPGLHQSITD